MKERHHLLDLALTPDTDGLTVSAPDPPDKLGS